MALNWIFSQAKDDLKKDLEEDLEDDLEIVDPKDAVDAPPDATAGSEKTLPIRVGMKDDFVDLQAPKNSGGVMLPYTIQTHLGMGYRGTSQDRVIWLPHYCPTLNRVMLQSKDSPLPHAAISSWLDYTKLQPSPRIAEIAANCIRLNSCVHTAEENVEMKAKVARYGANIDAFRTGCTTQHLKDYITFRKRIDLEQAAGLVVSAIHADGLVNEAADLVNELGGILGTSCMWLMESDMPGYGSKQDKIFNFAKKIASRCDTAKTASTSAKQAATAIRNNPNTTNYAFLVPILLQIRCTEPEDRCLVIPEWMFEEANLPIPDHHARFFAHAQELGVLESGGHSALRDGRLHPEAPRDESSIVLSRKAYRSLQRRINRLYQYWKPEAQFRRAIDNIEARVLYGTGWIEKAVLETTSVPRIAYYFFQFQRRFQRRIVGWSWGGGEGVPYGFFEKGVGATYYQNNTAIQSSFEQVLRRIAGLEGESVNMYEGNTVDLIDETCLLMKRYVDLYGQGNKENLVFKKGVRGGSGRGPVDLYNLLCDVLKQLKDRAQDEWILKVPGPVHKFLAKDIMSWNDSWQDDAFANGKIPGWEPWLKEKGLM